MTPIGRYSIVGITDGDPRETDWHDMTQDDAKDVAAKLNASEGELRQVRAERDKAQADLAALLEQAKESVKGVCPECGHEFLVDCVY